MGRPRILLADDHTLIAEGLRKLLEPEFDIAGLVSDGRALLSAALHQKPDVIILDIGMPLLNGIDAGRELLINPDYTHRPCFGRSKSAIL